MYLQNFVLVASLVAATGNDTLLPLDPPFPSISNLTAAAASADGTVIDEFQIDEEVRLARKLKSVASVIIRSSYGAIS